MACKKLKNNGFAELSAKHFEARGVRYWEPGSNIQRVVHSFAVLDQSAGRADILVFS